MKILDYLPIESGRLEHVELDVTKADSIAAAVERIRDITQGKLDFLFNNAGYGYMMPLMDADLEAVRRNFDVNVFGVLAVTQAFFPLLKAARGTVVNQSSISGLPGISQPFIATYSSTKAALTHMSDAMRVELAPFGIGVVILVTGDVSTQFWNNIQGAGSGLPASSHYIPIKAQVEAMMKGETNPPGSHDSDSWAAAVVNDLLSGTSRYIRRGYLSSIMPWVSRLVPAWILDYGFASRSGLFKLYAMQ